MIGVCQQRPEREVKEGQGPLVMMTKAVRMTLMTRRIEIEAPGYLKKSWLGGKSNIASNSKKSFALLLRYIYKSNM